MYFHRTRLGQFAVPPLFKFGFRVAQGGFVADASDVAQYLAVADAEKIIQLGDSVAHIHGLAAAGLNFD